MSNKAIKAIVFDAYGTLFDVYSIGALAEQLFPGKGEALAARWRDRQIDYTRLRTLSDRYKPFWDVTRDALIFACKSLGLEMQPEQQEALMAQYAALTPFSENRAVLQSLQARGLKLAILSNGNPLMLDTVVDAAGFRGFFNHILSADSVRKFKTAPQAYALAPAALGIGVDEMIFVSSNCWDVCGAAWFGFDTFWVNRAGAPLEELDIMPTAQGRTLTDLLEFTLTKLD
jgi:2-haloacid dehalogenase